MPKNKSLTIACPACHMGQTVDVPTSIDLEKDPNAFYAIMTDSLFTHTCEHCGKAYTVVGELFCIHREAGYAILLAPDAEDKPVPAPEELSGLKLRLVRNIDDLKEKLLILEGLMDDRAMELCKLYLALRQDEHHTTLRFTEHRDGELLFAVFDDEGELSHSVKIADSIYTELLPKARSFQEEKTNFLDVDARWVMEAITAESGAGSDTDDANA